jgi:hypothetical protein
MRLWSLHPSLLDGKGLVALWREGLLAQKVLLGETKGYRFHPQLKRFRESKNPVAAIGAYLWGVVDEAKSRGYRFDATKIATKRRTITISVTQGQLEFEYLHLKKKLRIRNPERLRMLAGTEPLPHRMLRAAPGPIEPWEIV